MELTIKIKMDNAAFSESATNGAESAEILRNLADKIEYSELTDGDSFPVYDSNGNRVGSAEVVNE